MNKQWWNLSPRAGVAWDVSGDGRTAIRSSYGLNYDFPSAQFLYIAASASPFSNRVELNGVPFDDPYRNVPGGDTHPLPRDPPFDAQFPGFGAYGVIDPDINSTRVQSWNVTFERQIGAAWQGSVSYLGSYADRMWGQSHINPANFMGLGPCTHRRRVVSRRAPSAANTDRRRTLFLENPDAGQWLGADRSLRGRRHAELSRPEAVVRPSRRQRPEPRRQLHAVALRRRHGRQRRFQPVHRRLHEAE